VTDATIDVSAGLQRHFKPLPGEPEYSDRWRRNFEQYLRNITRREKEEDYFVAQVVSRAIRWLEEHQGEDRLFLWVDCFDPHEPWDAPEELKRKYDPDYEGLEIIDPVPAAVEGYLTDDEMRHIQRLYAAEVEFVDRWVGKLLDAARSVGYFDNSLIVFTSDHGEPLNDHGIVRKCRPWNYEELAHVPLLLHPPGGDRAGTRVGGFVQPPDFLPTFCDALGVPLPSGVTGSSFWPLVLGEGSAPRDFAVSAHFRRSWTLRTERWTYQMLLGAREQIEKARASVGGRLFGNARELFDRQADRAEQVNLIEDNPELADALELHLRRFMSSLVWE
ncbi:MAG: sulfatase-like hydrolase/transferase, partial [Armatimonadetes bacterium]|nr:sulfatase-like hydrolase/transferase [Armatimonadota bacterium]